MVHVSILDGYVDEPTCLGVPPYISPYPRYLAGAVWAFDRKAKVTYLTIDQLRMKPSLLEILSSSNIIVVVAGMIVPGRYLAGFPASPNELTYLLKDISKPIKMLSGPAARYGFGMAGGKKVRDTSTIRNVFDIVAEGDGECVLFHLLQEKLNVNAVEPSLQRKSQDDIREFAIKGSHVVKQHPFFPKYLITEVETYRGCPRCIVGGCSFCGEPKKGLPAFRSIRDIVDEIEALTQNGINHIRLGNQPCLFSYMSKEVGNQEFPRPNPEAIERLFRGIRTVAPDLQTLHIDNANPGILAHYPDECKRIAKSIILYHTSGDVAAFGVESVDPRVIKNNNLKASPEEIFKAIRLLNSVGSSRGSNGMPELLPGLNFVFGLIGETKQTFDLNFEFLQRLLQDNLLVRRINLRQVIPLPGTPMSPLGTKNVKKHKALFHSFKRKVREAIERPMLQRLVPTGTILEKVYAEVYKGKVTFGRQLGSYPLLIGIPGIFPLHQFYNVKVVQFGYRSITGVPYPLDINSVSRETLESLPGVGKKRATRILVNRPLKDKVDLDACLDDSLLVKELLPYIKFS
jgi:radical SAM superfamily enzyme with C-terminal helix-hairpin-helix motif